ncbi:MAG: hypothetical protein Q7P63_02220 [Verrucomicrobiota bacterium JB022]|nr:hypothetical protein [Verrucomicrobiota bacterium JB022]
MRSIFVLLTLIFAAPFLSSRLAAQPEDAEVLPAVADDSTLELDFASAPTVDDRKIVWYRADMILGAYRFTGDFFSPNVAIEIALYDFNTEGIGTRLWSGELNASDPLTDIVSDDVLPKGDLFLRFSVPEADAPTAAVQIFYDFWYPWYDQQWQTLNIRDFREGNLDRIEQRSTANPYQTIWEAPQDGYIAFRLDEQTYPGDTIVLVEIDYDRATKEISEVREVARAKTYRCFYAEWTAHNERGFVEEGKWYAARVVQEEQQYDVTVGAFIEWTSGPEAHADPADALPLPAAGAVEAFNDISEPARYYQWVASADGQVLLAGNVLPGDYDPAYEYGQVGVSLVEGDAASTAAATFPAYGDTVLTVHAGDVYQIALQAPGYLFCAETVDQVGVALAYLEAPANTAPATAAEVVLPNGTFTVYDYQPSEPEAALWFLYTAPEDGAVDIWAEGVALQTVADSEPLTPSLAEEGTPGLPHYQFSLTAGAAYYISLSPRTDYRGFDQHFYEVELAFSFTDVDGDGLADSWEMRHFGGLAMTNGSGDADRDGRIDAAEFFLASDPRDPALKNCIQIELVEGQVQLQAVVNRSAAHRISWQTFDQMQDQWQTVALNQSASLRDDPSELLLTATGEGLLDGNGSLFRLRYE